MNYIENIETSEGPADRELMILQEVRSFMRREDAESLYKAAREKILNVNQWDKLTDTGSSRFQLIDSDAGIINGPAKANVFMRVDIAGKGTETGYGYDWLKIEDWVDMEDENENISLLSFSLRPSINPEQKNESIAHYFSDESVITLLLRRESNHVKLSVFESHLTINPLAEKSVAGTIRESLIGNAGICGLENKDWEEIVMNLLEMKMPKPSK